MPKPAHFYHLWTGGDWTAIEREHFAALEESGFEGRIEESLVAEGFEDVTLNRLREYCLTADPDTPVLYAHAKGSFRKMYLRDKTTLKVHPQEFQELWRRDMTDRLVRCWRSRVAELADYDLVGCYWVTPPEALAPHFAGNFWWARAEYIATLPALDTLDGTNRWEAERWVASNNPRVKALSQGFASVPLPLTPGSTAVEWWSDRATEEVAAT